MDRKERIKAAVKEFIAKEGVQRYAGHVESVLEANLIPTLETLYQDAFVRGYERGKQDEKDAKEIDASLASDVR